MSVQAIAFEYIKEKNLYAADGIEMAFEGDENGNVKELDKALLLVRNDLEPPTSKDLEDFYKFMKDLGFFEYQPFREMYDPVKVEISDEQLSVIRERNEW